MIYYLCLVRATGKQSSCCYSGEEQFTRFTHRIYMKHKELNTQENKLNNRFFAKIISLVKELCFSL